jgi:hypothetical protein
MCFERCGRCEEIIPFKHTCGHLLQLKCFQLQQAKKEGDEYYIFSCNSKVKITGHEKQIECGTFSSLKKNPTLRDQVNYSCSQKCDSKLACGHSCSHSCGSCRKHASSSSSPSSASLAIASSTHLPCKQPCDRPLFCGHRCLGICHSSTNCPPCQEQTNVFTQDVERNVHRLVYHVLILVLGSVNTKGDVLFLVVLLAFDFLVI